MKKVRMFWFKLPGAKFGNFGDELGPYIVQRISGCEIERVPIPRVGMFLVATYIKNLIEGRLGLRIIGSVVKALLMPGRYLTTVGSIIGWPSGPRTVWGSGILFYNERVSNGHFLAVRGKYTQRRLRALGYAAPEVLGDPAILLPLVYVPASSKKWRLGIIPHHTQYEYLSRIGTDSSYATIIDLDDDIEKIIFRICECDAIASASLHGLIVAHSYNIPAIWFNYSEIEWYGSDVKFYDYFSAVGIPEYVPFSLPVAAVIRVDDVIEILNENHEVSLPRSDLALLQKKLLDVAPFPVRKAITLKR